MKMEMESKTTSEIIAKKMWKVLRIVLYMLKTGISKSKLLVDLDLMMKKSNKLAGKAIDNLLTFHHHHMINGTCVSDTDSLNFISPRREYEFSCSNSPVTYRRNKFHNHSYNVRHFAKSRYRYDDTVTAAVQKIMEMLNNEAATTPAVEASPVVVLPGFGKSPAVVRQLRITDSPFPVKDEGSDLTVDRKAEEFIKKFYKDLKLQKCSTADQSPDPYMWGR